MYTRATIVKKMGFEAAHFLPRSHYEGKCNSTHGHSYALEIGVSGGINSDTGMVIDFSVLKNSMKKCIDHLDHRLLNEIVTNPTTENIILWIWEYLTKEERWFNISFIKLCETSNCYCIINRQDIVKQYYVWIKEVKGKIC